MFSSGWCCLIAFFRWGWVVVCFLACRWALFWLIFLALTLLLFTSTYDFSKLSWTSSPNSLLRCRVLQKEYAGVKGCNTIASFSPSSSFAFALLLRSSVRSTVLSALSIIVLLLTNHTMYSQVRRGHQWLPTRAFAFGPRWDEDCISSLVICFEFLLSFTRCFIGRHHRALPFLFLLPFATFDCFTALFSCVT